MHFAANMLFLLVFGGNVENRFGHLHYLLFCLAAGVASAWLEIAIDATFKVPTFGASGAIAGVPETYLFLFPYNKISTPVIQISAFYPLGSLFLLQLAGNVSSLAH